MMAATTLDSIDIANILAQELLFQQLVSTFDGLHSGVPTRTTPTLTPTTLRSIEQSFLELANETSSHSREAGFVPPLIEQSLPTPAQTQNTATTVPVTQQQQQQHQQQPLQQPTIELPPQTSQSQSVVVHPQQQQQQQVQHQSSNIQQVQQNQPQQTRRNMGGRRPTRTVGMTPEEEERRQIRRERNKMAAARCRKRRMDHTNALLEETDDLEQKKQNLQKEITQLQQTKDELEFMLDAHRTVCRLQSSSPPDIKPIIPDIIPDNSPIGNGNAELPPEEFSDLPCSKPSPHHHQQRDETNNHLNTNGLRPSRPNSLPVGFEPVSQRPNSLPIFTEPKPRPSSLQFKSVETPAFMKTANEVAGIPITTPSSGIPFNFDSLMEGGTGLTPVSTPLVPNCSSQQRSNIITTTTTNHNLAAVDLSSPDANPPKLVSL